MTTRHAVVDTVLGDLTLVAGDDALIGVYFERHRLRPSTSTFGPLVDSAADALLGTAHAQLTAYLTGERTGFDLTTAPSGDDTQLRIWALLTGIPFGATVTYGDLADTLADGTTAWEVGQAVGRNPLCIVVPCHRVIGRDGGLTGYAGGLTAKQYLLELEEPAEAKAARLF